MLYLAQFTGDGTKGNEYRPAGSFSSYGIIDLRVGNVGLCLLRCNEIPPLTAIGIAGGAGETLLPGVISRVANALGINFNTTPVSCTDLLEQLLFNDWGKWAPIRASSVRDIKEIWFMNELWLRKAAPRSSGAGFTDPSDNFDRVDNADLGTNWTPITSQGSFRITSNRCVVANLGNDSAEYWNADSFANDQFSQATIIANTGGSDTVGVGCAIRCSTVAQTFYRCICSDSALVDTQIAKNVAGSVTQLASFISDFATNDVFRVETEGTVIRVLKNGNQTGSAVDTAISSGRPGVCYSSVLTAASLDDWSGGDFTPAAGPGTVFFPWLRQ